MISVKTTFASFAFAVLAVGCASFGEDEFACGGPKGSVCMSARDVYQQSSAGEAPVFTTEESRSDRDSGPVPQTTVTPTQQQTITDPVVDTFVTPRLPDQPVPIRTPATIMRIKVFAYEEAKSGALYAPGYIFTEIEPRRWTIGNPQSAAALGRLLTPLNTVEQR